MPESTRGDLAPSHTLRAPRAGAPPHVAGGCSSPNTVRRARRSGRSLGRAAIYLLRKCRRACALLREDAPSRRAIHPARRPRRAAGAAELLPFEFPRSCRNFSENRERFSEREFLDL